MEMSAHMLSLRGKIKSRSMYEQLSAEINWEFGDLAVV